MTKPRVPMRSVIGRALIAPLYLEAASWKALVRSLLTLALVGLLPVAAGYFHMGWMVQVAAFGFLWAAILLLAWNFERHLLLGAAAGGSDPRLRQRYGLNFLALVVGGVLLTVAIWYLLQWVLAAIFLLHLAANDNNPLPSVPTYWDGSWRFRWRVRFRFVLSCCCLPWRRATISRLRESGA